MAINKVSTKFYDVKKEYAMDSAVIVGIQDCTSPEIPDPTYTYHVYCAEPEVGLQCLQEALGIDLHIQDFIANTKVFPEGASIWDWLHDPEGNPFQIQDTQVRLYWHGSGAIDALATFSWIQRCVTKKQAERILDFCCDQYS